MKIVVIGQGVWGTALASLLTKNKKQFSFWKKGQKIEDDSIIVICIPTQAIREVLTESVKGAKNLIVINGAKGIEKKTNKLPYQIALDVLGRDIDYFALIGPSFAQEVKDETPTLVNVGYIKEKNSKMVRDLFRTDYFRVRRTHGVHALELASAFKNVYAIACGVADGMGFGTNTRVKLILLAIEEFYALSKKLSYTIDKKALPGTIGDLILTCNSKESRNFSFGRLLPKEKTTKALEIVGQTVEGFTTAESIPYFEKETGVELRLARFVYEIIHENNPEGIKDKFSEFVKHA